MPKVPTCENVIHPCDKQLEHTHLKSIHYGQPWPTKCMYCKKVYENQEIQWILWVWRSLIVSVAGMWFDKSKKSWKMGSRPGSSFGLDDKATWTSWMFNFGGFTDSPHPHKQETRGLVTIQATCTSFYPSFKKVFRQREICEKSRTQEKILRTHRPGEGISVKVVQNSLMKSSLQNLQ